MLLRETLFWRLQTRQSSTSVPTFKHIGIFETQHNEVEVGKHQGSEPVSSWYQLGLWTSLFAHRNMDNGGRRGAFRVHDL